MKKKNIKLYGTVLFMVVICLLAIIYAFNFSINSFSIRTEDSMSACQIIVASMDGTSSCFGITETFVKCLRNVVIQYDHDWIYNPDERTLHINNIGKGIYVIQDAALANSRTRESATMYCGGTNLHGYSTPINYDKATHCTSTGTVVNDECGAQQFCLLGGCAEIPNDCSAKAYECGNTTIRGMPLVCGVCDNTKTCVNNKCVIPTTPTPTPSLTPSPTPTTTPQSTIPATIPAKTPASTIPTTATVTTPVSTPSVSATPTTSLEPISLDGYIWVGIAILIVIIVILMFSLGKKKKHKK